MKNLKVYQKAIAIVAAGSIILLSGCSSKQTDDKKETKLCSHLTVYFEDTPITFKECEGYEISYDARLDGGIVRYNISKDGEIIISHGRTTKANKYLVNHDVTDEIIDEKSVQKTK